MNWTDFDDSELEDSNSELEHVLDSESEEKQILENRSNTNGSSEEQEEEENLVRPDRISDLPDEILVHILSLLPTTQEAIKTGTLSKRWQFLWTTVPSLIFVEDISMTKFIPTVNQTLIQCRNSKIKAFRVHFCYYDDQVPAQINVWIRYAVSCNVEELDLDFSNNSDEDFIKHDVPQHLFNNLFLTYLRLCHVNFAPMGAINWKALKSLLLWNVWLNEGMIQKILMGSPELEFLELGRCYGFRRLHITSPSVKRLVVFCCFEVHEEDVIPVDVIEVSAPYITSLSIEGNLTAKKFLLHNLQSLLEANVGWYFVNPDEVIVCQETLVELWIGILQSLQHVNVITIGDQCMEALSKLEMKGLRSPVSKRKCLKIASFIRRGWFPGLVNLLESSPDLETLLINADPPFSEKYTDSCHTRANYLAYQKKSVKCLQLHLKTVKIAYFIEWDPESELAQFLLKDGCVLQTVTIFARSVRNRFVNSLSQGLLEGITEKLVSCPRASKDSVVIVKG